MQQTVLPVPTRHRFTVDDLARMLRAGILPGDARLELIDGELFDRQPIGWANQACVNRLTERFVHALQGRAIVQPQGPVRLSDRSLPQPDLALLRPRADFYARSGPGSADVLLLVEVSDTTLAYDRDIKVPLYARAGIPEVWVVDLAGGQVLVFRTLMQDGYRDSQVHRPGERISPQAFPDMSLAVDDLLGT